MTVYTHIKNCLDKLGEKPADILEKFATLSEKDREFLKIVFGEPDETALASKISKHKKYLKDGGNKTYLFGTQPRTQHAYIDRNKPTGNDNKARATLRESAAIARQTSVPFTIYNGNTDILSRISKNILREIHKGFDPLKHESYLEQFFTEVVKDAGFNEDIISYMTKITECIKSHVKTTESGKYYIDEDILKSDKYKLLPAFSKFLVRQFVKLISTLRYLSQDIPKDGTIKDVLLFRDEVVLSYLALNLISKTSQHYKTAKALQANLGEALDNNSMPVWSVDNHGQYVDSIYEGQLGSKEDGKRVFPYKGEEDDKVRLYEFDEKTKSMVIASTLDMTYKEDAGRSALIITLDGQIYTFNHERGDEISNKKFHSIITDGRSVMFAGSIKIDSTGKIVKITNSSGHYKPTITLELLLFLEQNGLLHSEITFSEEGSFTELTSGAFVRVLMRPSTKSYLRKYFKDNGFSGLAHLIRVCSDHIDRKQIPFVLTKLISQYRDQHGLSLTKNNLISLIETGALKYEKILSLLGKDVIDQLHDLIKEGKLQDKLYLIHHSITKIDYTSQEALNDFLNAKPHKNTRLDELPEEIQADVLSKISQLYLEEKISLAQINNMDLNEKQITHYLISDDLINALILRGEIVDDDGELKNDGDAPFLLDAANGYVLDRILEMGSKGTLSLEAYNKLNQEAQNSILEEIDKDHYDPAKWAEETASDQTPANSTGYGKVFAIDKNASGEHASPTGGDTPIAEDTSLVAKPSTSSAHDAVSQHVKGQQQQIDEGIAQTPPPDPKNIGDGGIDYSV